MKKARMELRRVSRSFGTGEGRVQALDEVSLAFEPGSFTAIMGKSGCGKTTLLRLLGGLDLPDEGEVLVQDQDISRWSDARRCWLRREGIGYIFQDLNLFEELTIEENITLPFALEGIRVNATELEDLLTMLELKELRNRLPSQVSGGQRQKAAIARGLLAHLPVILADEPTGALDQKSAAAFLDALEQARIRWRPTIVLVTHDIQTAMRADRIVRMEDGRIVDDGQRH